MEAGCGPETKPECKEPIDGCDACVSYYCTCDGRRLQGSCGCGEGTQWLHEEACTSTDAGLDAAPETGTDASPDATSG